MLRDSISAETFLNWNIVHFKWIYCFTFANFSFYSLFWLKNLLPDHQFYNCKQADWSNDFFKWSTRLIYAGVAAVFTRWLLYQQRSKKCDKNCWIMNGWPTTHIWGSQDQKITKGKRLLSICALSKIEKCKSVRSRESNPSPVNSSLWLSLSLANPLPTKLIWFSCNYLIFDCVRLDLRFCGTADVGNTFRHDYKTHGILIEKVCKMWNTVISKRGVSIQGKENYCSVLEPWRLKLSSQIQSSLSIAAPRT